MPVSRSSLAGACFAEAADAEDQARPQEVDDVDEGVIAGGIQRLALFAWQLVRGPVAPGVLEEGQRAVVPDEEPTEECLGGSETGLRPAPEALTADLPPRAGESRDRPGGMLLPRRFDAAVDAEPVAHGGYFAEGHPGLHHAEGTRVHSEEQDVRLGSAVTVQVLTVCPAGVVERVVDMADGWPEAALRRRAGQRSRDRRGRSGVSGHVHESTS